MYEELNILFRLRVKLNRAVTLAVTAWDANHVDSTGHSRIDVEAAIVWPDGLHKKRQRTVIFARGDTYCSLASGHCLDSKRARALVLSLLAMKPGDTDSDYFAGYSAEQLEFATSYGEGLSMIAEERYGSR